MMKKREKTRHTRSSILRRRAPLLAPAALAALLAGPASAAEDVARDVSAAEERGAIETSHEQLRRLAEHPDRERRVALAALLPEVVAWMSPLDRIELVSSWATSDSPRLRLAIARSLRHLMPVPGSVTAIEHLATDPDPAVRAAIAEASWLRRREDPERLIEVLHRLAEDDNLFVQEVARLALGDA